MAIDFYSFTQNSYNAMVNANKTAGTKKVSTVTTNRGIHYNTYERKHSDNGGYSEGILSLDTDNDLHAMLFRFGIGTDLGGLESDDLDIDFNA